MSNLDGPHDFIEDVDDYSMCICGTPALTHHRIERDPLDPEDRDVMETLIKASHRGIGSITKFAKQEPQGQLPSSYPPRREGQ